MCAILAFFFFSFLLQMEQRWGRGGEQGLLGPKSMMKQMAQTDEVAIENQTGWADRASPNALKARGDEEGGT